MTTKKKQVQFFLQRENEQRKKTVHRLNATCVMCIQKALSLKNHPENQHGKLIFSIISITASSTALKRYVFKASY
jgi:hypothetical protein